MDAKRKERIKAALRDLEAEHAAEDAEAFDRALAEIAGERVAKTQAEPPHVGDFAAAASRAAESNGGSTADTNYIGPRSTLRTALVVEAQGQPTGYWCARVMNSAGDAEQCCYAPTAKDAMLAAFSCVLSQRIEKITENIRRFEAQRQSSAQSASGSGGPSSGSGGPQLN